MTYFVRIQTTPTVSVVIEARNPAQAARLAVQQLSNVRGVERPQQVRPSLPERPNVFDVALEVLKVKAVPAYKIQRPARYGDATPYWAAEDVRVLVYSYEYAQKQGMA